MARNGKAKQEARRAAKFQRLEEAARAKFDGFNLLNKKIDTKTSSGSTAAEKLRIEADRASARSAKAKIVARQSYAVTDEIGAGSSKGMYFAKGQQVKQVRGKEKIRKTASSPSVRFKGEHNGKK